MPRLSDCCEAVMVQDSSGDKICTACGLITDNYPEEAKEDMPIDKAYEAVMLTCPHWKKNRRCVECPQGVNYHLTCDVIREADKTWRKANGK
jgi:hypothetical protein